MTKFDFDFAVCDSGRRISPAQCTRRRLGIHLIRRLLIMHQPYTLTMIFIFNQRKGLCIRKKYTFVIKPIVSTAIKILRIASKHAIGHGPGFRIGVAVLVPGDGALGEVVRAGAALAVDAVAAGGPGLRGGQGRDGRGAARIGVKVGGAPALAAPVHHRQVAVIQTCDI